MGKLKTLGKKKSHQDFVEIDEMNEKMPFRAKDWWKYLISLALLVIYLFPFYVIINVSLKSFTDYGYKIDELSLNLHEDDIPNIETEYENRFSSLGYPIYMVKVTK